MGPFASAAASYYANGWHPLPLPPGAKAPPPDGTTGGAPHVDVDTINGWVQHRPDHNVALRLATDVVGIDVDNYGTHHGADTLARLIGDHGPLPPTWSTTARGAGPSRISYYRVPEGVRFPGSLGDGIDVIQHHHRYAVGPPSVHPDTRTIYRWWWHNGELSALLSAPHVDDIPALPEAWLSLQHRPGQLAAIHADNINALLGAGADYGDDSIAATIANRESWHYRLVADGWMAVRSTRGNETAWRRPGKATGLSAVLHEPDGPFVVFSTSIAALQHRWAETADGTAWAFSMFGYIAATRYGGDRSRCAREERQHADDNGRATFLHTTAAITAALLDGDTTEDDARALWHLARFDDWGADDLDANEWLAWPLIPAGRSVAIHAPAKAGKSIVTLAAVASMVGGRDLYGRWPLSDPVTVLYVDYEMTKGDLFDRLDELGYGPDDTELHTRLHYAVLPSVAPLDTFEGGTALLAMARSVEARCVILDTFGRAVHGPENDADTVRDFYRYTGATLKAAGITVVRLDHTGKDHEKGQRGTSSKNEDVDLVWKLTRTDRGALLEVTHTRMSNVPKSINLVRVEDAAAPGLVKWVSYDEAAYPAGTAALIAECDTLGIAVDVSANKAYDAYRTRGGKARRASFLIAHKCRKDRFPAVIHNPNGHAPSTGPVPPGLPGAIATPEPPLSNTRNGPSLYRERGGPVLNERTDEGHNGGPVEFPY